MNAEPTSPQAVPGTLQRAECEGVAPSDLCGFSAPQIASCEAEPCEVKGCTEIGVELWLPGLYDDPAGPYYVCHGHMRDQGFCPGCHQFCAGLEEFDFSRTGYCSNCASEFEEDDENDWEYGCYWEGGP